MKGWRSKLIFMFILYFAGFATAVYMLAPQPDAEPGQNIEQNAVQTAFANFDSQEFVKSFNSGMHKCIDLGKDAALRTSKYIKQKTQDSES
ncbi:MAG: hypothetical protein JW787_10765 [Sedimentisphaerales bacterium]|nr:hypothetical protein [Sedimentisphaerales bacterium]